MWIGKSRLRELLALVLRRRRWFRVRGNSMLPTLKPGDMVLIKKTATTLPSPGLLVAVRDPSEAGRNLIKRVSTSGDGRFYVLSDNPDGARDSRRFGTLGLDALHGVVTLVFTTDGRLILAENLEAAPTSRP